MLFNWMMRYLFETMVINEMFTASTDPRMEGDRKEGIDGLLLLFLLGWRNVELFLVFYMVLVIMNVLTSTHCRNMVVYEMMCRS